MIENIVPILRVDDLERSQRYYVDVLGFSLDWAHPRMISVSRAGKGLMLSLQHQGQAGTWVWIGCEDAEALHSELKSRGAVIRDAPQNFEWAYEFQVEDPDGHVLRFGSESRQGVALGEFKS